MLANFEPSSFQVLKHPSAKVMKLIFQYSIYAQEEGRKKKKLRQLISYIIASNNTQAQLSIFIRSLNKGGNA